MERRDSRESRDTGSLRWVRVHWVGLEASARSSAVPTDTSAVPFELWLNGWLDGDAAVGDQVRVQTVTGRLVEGELFEENPGYRHSFGSPPIALKRAGNQAYALVHPEVAE
jgi:hypothetical protein